MVIKTMLGLLLAMQLKMSVPVVNDVYYTTESGAITETVPTDECFATVVKQGNKSYLSSEIDLKKEYGLKKRDHIIIILNDVGEIISIIDFGQ